MQWNYCQKRSYLLIDEIDMKNLLISVFLEFCDLYLGAIKKPKLCLKSSAEVKDQKHAHMVPGN